MALDRTGPAAGCELGVMLREWRSLRGMSQLDVSLQANVSQRHLSFIESGRSAPGRAKLIDIAEALDIPLRDRNALMLAAGYAPIYAEDTIDEPRLAPIKAALDRLLRQQEPYPAILMDRYWDVLATNDAAPRFFGRFIDMAVRSGRRNMLHLVFDPAGMRPHVRDWPRTAAALIQRVRREAVGRALDRRSQDLLDELRAFAPDAFEARTTLLAAPDEPVIPLAFELDGRALRYFSIISTLGTPQTVAAQEVRLESMFPADEETEAHHRELFSS